MRRTLALTLVLGAGPAAAAPDDDAGVTERAAPAEGTSGEEVIVVTGTRSEMPRAASPVTTEVISRQRLAESGVQTAADALGMRPGMWFERGRGGTTGLSLQGLG